MGARNPEVNKLCRICNKVMPHQTYKNGKVRTCCKGCWNPRLKAAKARYRKKNQHHPEWKKREKARRLAREAHPAPPDPHCQSCGTIPAGPPYPKNTVMGLQRSHEEGYEEENATKIKWNCLSCHYKRDRWAVGKGHGYSPWAKDRKQRELVQATPDQNDQNEQGS